MLRHIQRVYDITLTDESFQKHLLEVLTWETQRLFNQ